MHILDGLNIARHAPSSVEAHVAMDLAGFKTGMHFHEEYQIIVVLGGERIIEHREGVAHLTAGDCLIIPPGQPHRGSSVGSSRASFKTLYLASEGLGDALTGTSPLQSAVVRTRDRRVVGAVEELAEDATGAQRTGSSSALIEVLSLALRGLVVPFSDKSALDRRQRLARVRETLIESMEVRPALDPLARLSGMSKFHLVRSFTRAFGLSPYAYNIRHRVNRAKPMLAAGTPVCEVALDLGFYDQSHFGLHFRQLAGLPPATYQRKVRSSNASIGRK